MQPVLEELEDRTAPAHLVYVSGPEIMTSGWATGGVTVTPHTDPTMLTWDMFGQAIPPATATFGGPGGTGSFSARGTIVVRVEADQNDTPGQKVLISLNWLRDYSYALDPIAPGTNGNVYGDHTSNSFTISANLVGVGSLPDSAGRSFDTTGGWTSRHNNDSVNSTAGANPLFNNGFGSFAAVVGSSFSIRFNGSGESKGLWVGGSTNPHGQVGVSVRLAFSLQQGLPDITPVETNSTPALAWNAESGVDLHYRNYGVPLPPANVAYFWGNQESGVVSRLGGPIAIRNLDTRNFTPKVLTLSADFLHSQPVSANCLIAVLDYGNQIDEGGGEADNEIVLDLRDPDFKATGLIWEADGDARLEYVTQGKPPTGAVAQFYWATGPNNNDIINPNAPILERNLVAGLGAQKITVSAQLLANRPANATFLLAYLDASDAVDETDEFNNIARLESLDLIAESLSYNINRLVGERGVDLSYVFKNLDPAAEVKVAYYWATGTTPDTTIGLALSQRTLSPGAGMFGSAYGLDNHAARWGIPPDEARYILAIIDPDNTIHESDETNNFVSRELHSRAEILGADQFNLSATVTGANLTINFTPGGGGSNLSEAEIRFGVDHFNWEQTIISVPTHWTQTYRPAGWVLPPGSSPDLWVNTLPWLDPQDYGQNESNFVITSSLAGRSVRLESRTNDYRPFYYNEPDEIRKVTAFGQLQFSDTPRVPSDFLATGEYVQYQTLLVGVGYTGKSVTLSGVKPIKWRSNATYDVSSSNSGGVFLKVSEVTPELPAVSAGGVSDVAVSSDPQITGILSDTGVAGDHRTSDNTLAFQGTAQAGRTVTLTRVGTGVIGQTTADGLGVWSFDYTATTLPDGIHTFTATDDQNLTSALFGVIVDTTPPAALTLQGSQIAENQPLGTTIGFLDTTDFRGPLSTFSLVAGIGGEDNASFDIQGNVIQSVETFDFETRSAYSIRVRATTVDGTFTEQTFTIQVTNVYEGPTDLALSTTTILEHRPTGTQLATLTATVPESGHTVTYYLEAGTGDSDNSHFYIIGDKLYGSAPLDFASGATRSIRIHAVDETGQFFEKTVPLNVTAVNDAPSGTNQTVTTTEGTAYTFTAADFGFSDPLDTPANILAGVKITTLPTLGTLTNNGVAVVAGATVSVANINAGLLKFTPVSNASGSPYASFTFQVQDDGGTAAGGIDLDATPNTITVNVTAVNDAPSGTNKTVTTTEGTTYTFTAADFGFSDTLDTPANILAGVKITTLPAAGSLTNNGVAVIAGATISVADIVAGRVKFTPVSNASGAPYTSFTFQVQDNGGTTNGGIDLDPTPNTLTVNVTAINDAPSGTNQTVTTTEGTAYTFTAADFGFTDPLDTPANILAGVKVTTLPTLGTLTNNGVAVVAGATVSVANINAGLLRFTPAANASGAPYASFTFQVQDNGGTTNGGIDLDATPNTLTLNVTAGNDAPVLDTSVTPTLNPVTASPVTSRNSAAVAEWLGSAVTDADVGDPSGLAVVGLTVGAEGTWQFTRDAGITWQDFGSVTASSARLLTATDRIRFLPGAGYAGGATLSFRAWDQTTGTPGQTADLSPAGNTGGSTAFSAAFGTVNVVEGPVTLHGTTLHVASGEAPDTIEFATDGVNHTITLNTVIYTFAATLATDIFLDGQTGSDLIRVRGGTGVDSASITYLTGTLTGAGYAVTWHNSETVYVYSGGGEDTATLFDTAGNDVFQSRPEYAYMLSGSAYINWVVGFSKQVAAYSMAGGLDYAYLFDSAENDTYAASTAYGYMQGTGFIDYAVGFDNVYGYSMFGGQDAAYLYDSTGDDVFQASTAYCYMQGTTFVNWAVNFHTATGSASSGTDRAYLFDSTADDLFQGLGVLGILYAGTGQTLVASSFDDVFAMGIHGGTNSRSLGVLAYAYTEFGVWV